MKSYFDEAEFYANENYSNASGWSNFDTYDYFDEYNYAGGGSQHSNANPAGSLPYIINIQNTATTDQANVSILGANVNINAANTGNPANIVITMDNGAVTYIQFLQSIISEPFRVGLMYLQSANAQQPFRQLLVEYTEPNGRTVNTPITPALDPMQQQSNVTVIRHMFPVNANTSIATTILASATLTLRLYPSEVLDISRSLVGRSVAKDFASPSEINQQKQVSGRM
tara:strand:+ start:167 stop:847 length:681 start_codon:yes stop_codon:yes gene_type:complete